MFHSIQCTAYASPEERQSCRLYISTTWWQCDLWRPAQQEDPVMLAIRLSVGSFLQIPSLVGISVPLPESLCSRWYRSRRWTSGSEEFLEQNALTLRNKNHPLFIRYSWSAWALINMLLQSISIPGRRRRLSPWWLEFAYPVRRQRDWF